MKYLGRAKRREGQKVAVWSPLPPGFSGSDISLKGPQNGNGCDLGDLFLMEHSAPGAEVGFSGRLLLVCEVSGPGKAARGSEGGGVVAATTRF